MQKKSLISEQKKLLVSENILKNQAKRLASGRGINRKALFAAVSGASAAGLAAATKLGDNTPLAYAQQLKEASQTLDGQALLVALSDIMANGHAAIEQLAMNGGFLIAEASGGTPKRVISEVVRLSLHI